MDPNNPNQNKLPEQIQTQNFLDMDSWETQDFLKIFVHHRWKLFWIMLSFLLLGFFYNHFWHKTYEAYTTVELPASIVQNTDDAIKSLASMPSTGDPIQTYIDVARSNTIAAYVIQKLNLLDNPHFQGFSRITWKKTKPSLQGLESYLSKVIISIANDRDSDILTLKADVKDDPKLAADLANAWAEGFILVNLAIAQESAKREYEFIHNQLAIMGNKLQMDKLIEKNYLNPSNQAQSDEIIYSLLLNQDLQSQIQANEDTSGIVVVDVAQVPQGHIWPNLYICLLLSFFLGLGFGITGIILLEKFQDRIKLDEDLIRVTGLTQLGHIPNFRREHGKIIFLSGDLFSRKHLITDEIFQFSPYRESFKVLRTNFVFTNVDQNIKTFAILSPSAGEGKSLVSSDMALALAETGKKVLLIDADLRKPTINLLFGLKVDENIGLPLLLADNSKINQMLMDSGFKNLTVLPNGIIPPNPAEILGSESLKRLVDNLKQKFDYIIFDGAPILPVTDSVVMAKNLDGVILLGRWDQTRRASLRRAYLQMVSLNIRVFGTVLNAVEIHNNLYGYYSYGYGYGYGYEGKNKNKKNS